MNALAKNHLETIASIPQVIEYTENSNLSPRELLDSLFVLRDIVTQHSNGILASKSGFIKNLEETIIKLSTYFTQVKMDLSNSLVSKKYIQTGHMEDGLLFLNQEFQITNLNSAFLHKFGYAKQELLGKSFQQLFSPSSQNMIQFAMQQLSMNLRFMMELDVEAVTHSGQKFRAVIKIKRQNIGEEPPSYSCLVQDITYIHETKSILNLLSMALESVGEGIVIFEPQPDGKILYVNQAMERISRFARHQLLGKPFSIFAGKFYNEDTYRDIIEHSLQNGWQGEVENQRKTGESYPVYLNTQPVKDENGEIVAVVGIQRDITREKQSKQEILNLKSFIEKIINNLHHYILVTDEDFRIQFWNDSLARDLDIPPSRAIEENLLELIPELNKILYANIIKNLLHTPQSFSKIYLLNITGKAERFYQVTISPLSQIDSRQVLLWVIQDIHEEEEMKQQITWQNARLKFLENLAGFLNSSPDLKTIVETFSNELGQILPYTSLDVLFGIDVNKQFFKLFFSSENFTNTFPEDCIVKLQDLPFYPELSAEPHSFIYQTPVEEEKGSPPVIMGREGIRQVIVLPISFSGEILGWIYIGHDDPNFFRSEDLEFLEQVVSHLTVALKNSIQFEQIATQNQKLYLINKIFASVRANKPLDDLFKEFLENLTQMFDYSCLALYQSTDTCNWNLIFQFHSREQKEAPLPQSFHLKCSDLHTSITWIKNVFEDDHHNFFDTVFPAVPKNSAFLVHEETKYFGDIILVGFSQHYLLSFSHQFHIQILEEILKDISIAIDQQALFHKTIQAEQEWASTFDAVKIGLAVLNENRQVVRANKTFWEIFAKNDVLREGVPYQQFLQYFGFRTSSDADRTDYHKFDTCNEWYDGKNDRYFYQQYYPLEPGKRKSTGGILTIQDVTEERRKEAHILYLSRFPETNPNLILSLNHQGEIVYFNPSVQKLLKELKFREKSILKIIPEKLIERIRSGEINSSTAHEFVHEIRNRIFQFIVYQPSPEENYYLYGSEITERLKLQDQLIQTERMRAMGEMAAGVAHDFNNLLATILGRTQLLTLKIDSPAIQSELKIIEKAAQDGGQIVKRLQEATRAQRERSFRPIQLSELLNDSILFSAQKLKLKTQVKGHYTQLITDINENIMVYGNPIELKEVFTNLLFNAYDAMPEGGKLYIKTELIGNDQVSVSIRDTGLGISPEILNKIFDPFFTTKGERGTGLGLSVVYNIVTAHKGTIQVKSALNQGTEFIITLPRSKQKKIPHAEKVKSRLLSNVKNLKLLVVDDEIELLETMAEILKMRFKKVDTAHSGMEALKKARETHFDVVLSDLGMPEMSGWEVAQKIKEHSKNTKIVLVTGWGMQAEEELKNHPYVDQIISKPYELNQLIETIQKLSHTNKPVSTSG